MRKRPAPPSRRSPALGLSRLPRRLRRPRRPRQMEFIELRSRPARTRTGPRRPRPAAVPSNLPTSSRLNRRSTRKANSCCRRKTSRTSASNCRPGGRQPGGASPLQERELETPSAARQLSDRPRDDRNAARLSGRPGPGLQHEAAARGCRRSSPSSSSSRGSTSTSTSGPAPTTAPTATIHNISSTAPISHQVHPLGGARPIPPTTANAAAASKAENARAPNRAAPALQPDLLRRARLTRDCRSPPGSTRTTPMSRRRPERRR